MADKKFDLAFTDTETTGLDPKIHELTEVAIIRIDPYTLEEKARFHRYFLPFAPPSEEVVKINGYSEALWRERGAKPICREDVVEIGAVLKGSAFAGQNPTFDRGFIHAAFGVYLPTLEMDYHLIDVATLAWPLVVAGLLPGMGLKHSRKLFDCAGEQTHSALQDILDTIHVYKQLMEIYMSTAFVAWMRMKKEDGIIP